MFVAQQLRQKSIAEYLLYMWQVEDLLRAFHLDFEKLRTQYLSRYTGLTSDQREELEAWYRNLIDMMHSEGVTERGHLQINRNVMQNLSELHARLMGSQKFPYYRTAYLSALPIIVELRAKNGNRDESELETCFNFLYGLMLLGVQGKPVSEPTEKAQKTVVTFLGMLSDYYNKDKEEPLDF
jgi:hypothetical protein